MNVARLNMSHGTTRGSPSACSSACARRPRDRRERRGDGRPARARDPHRQGRRRRRACWQPGQPFSLYTDGRVGSSARRLGLLPGAAPTRWGSGDVILLDDGKIELEVVGVRRGEIETRVRAAAPCADAQGRTCPARTSSCRSSGSRTARTSRSRWRSDVDYIAASFVRSAADVEEIRPLPEETRRRASRSSPRSRAARGVEHLEEIVAAADGTMVARGDLGVEMPLAEVPVLQKRIIRATVTAGKPVITATQMLDSMERNPRPTRAEVRDVANAIFDGSSALMLSGETAVGRYPVEAVEIMASLALVAEESLREYGELQKIVSLPADKMAEAVAQAAIAMSQHLSAAAIICLTESGRTARRISKYRPACPILAVAMDERVVRRLAMNWGVVPMFYQGEPIDVARVEFAIERAKKDGILRRGDVVVATGSSKREGGSTDQIRVVTVG